MVRTVCAAIVATVCFSVSVSAQRMDGIEKIMLVLGVDSPEDVDPSEIELMADFLEHPLKINMTSESRLMASGLLTRFQVASLTDYRTRHGNVMSYMELASIDGFTPEAVGRLKDFISLESYGMYDGKRLTGNDFVLRSAMRFVEQESPLDFNYGLKYRLTTEKLSLAAATNKSYSASELYPDAYSGALTYDFRRTRGHMIIGDFNARFGQGLTLWTGSFMTSLTSPDAFMRKPSGVSPTWSFTGSTALTGLAGSFTFKRITLNVLTAFPGIKTIGKRPNELSVKPAVNVSWSGLHGSVSMTQLVEMTGVTIGNFRIPVLRSSVDAAFCIRGVNLYGDMAYDWVSNDVHLLAGSDFRIGESIRVASLAKYLPGKWESTAAQHGVAASAAFAIGKMMTPSGENGFGAARRSHLATFSIDAVRYVESKDDAVPQSIQVKLLGDWKYLVSRHLEVKLRLSERVRTWGQTFRTDLRSDVIYMNGPFDFTLRMNVLRCVQTSFAGYLEQGYKEGRISAYLRQGMFFVDDWEDRIYVYERDAPGSFNVPAMYGRGWFASVVMSLRITDALRLYMRASCVDYGFMPVEKRKPGKAELKFQLVLRNF